VDLTSYITALLSDNDTVIIPGFGAFISVYKPAVIKENEIIPPGKELKFFPQIKNNDNLLAMQIARAKKISYDDAFKRIERATAKIILQLDKGEKVVFGELGEFSYDENGIIQFTHYQAENPITQVGYQPVSLEDVVETPEETTNIEEPAPKEKITEEIPESVENDQIANEIPPVGSSHQEPVDLQYFKKADYEDHAEVIIDPKKKKNFIWLWILLAVIIVAAVLYFLFADKKQVPENNDRLSQEIKKEQVLPETPKSDSIQPTDTTSTAIQQPAITSAVVQFHLVGGGFKSEENALKYIAKLKEKGIEGKLLGQKGSIYVVGIASFSTEQEAYNELNRRMRENPDWKLWVYEK
jgi:hypothetical protein